MPSIVARASRLLSRGFQFKLTDDCVQTVFQRKEMKMKALISQRHETGTCIWCEKETECVTAEFSDGFLAKNEICWRCLQKAVKVRSQQKVEPARGGTTSNAAPERSASTAPTTDVRNSRSDIASEA